jgi:hypothetical protein
MPFETGWRTGTGRTTAATKKEEEVMIHVESKSDGAA